MNNVASRNLPYPFDDGIPVVESVSIGSRERLDGIDVHSPQIVCYRSQAFSLRRTGLDCKGVTRIAMGAGRPKGCVQFMAMYISLTKSGMSEPPQPSLPVPGLRLQS